MEGLEFGVQGLGCRVEGSVFGVKGLEIKVEELGLRA